MDPAATLIKAMDHLAKGERDEAAQSFRDLAEWLSFDGAMPEVTVQQHVVRVTVYIER